VIDTVAAAPAAGAPTARATSLGPAWPAGWWVVGRSRRLRPGARRSLHLAGHDLVLYRTADREARPVLLDAHCPHMGTHLRHGRVVGEVLRCAMHHWRIDSQGAARTPSGKPCGQVRSWRVEERYGLLFAHLPAAGPTSADSLPAPADADGYRWHSAGPTAVATSWQTLMVSGFDMQHLTAVHHRELLGAPELTSDDARRLRLRYRSRPIGSGLSDRLMGLLGRAEIDVTMTCHGPIFVVETVLGRRRTAAILGLVPGKTGGVTAHGSFAVRRDAVFAPLQARIAAWLFIEFLRRDFAIIEDMRLDADVEDIGVRAMSRFLAGLPAAAAPPAATTPDHA
jgi:nitrite reductase/ring-hydroxylating ferredoxin subunit